MSRTGKTARTGSPCRILSARSPAAIAEATTLLRRGKLVIIPTDTIYGIAALPSVPPEAPELPPEHGGAAAVIERLYEVRGRAPEPARPFLISHQALIHHLGRATTTALRLARRFWPGTLTLILPPAGGLDEALRSLPIAVRQPSYSLLTPLLEATGGYVMASGAIRSGYSPAITAQEAAQLFGEEVPLILDGGPAPYGVPSTIVDCIQQPPVIVRRGVLAEERIWDTLA